MTAKTKNYILVDMAAVHATCKRCIPNEEMRSNLKVGEFAQVTALNDRGQQEGFWVEVVGNREGGYLGKVANDLDTLDLPEGDLIDVGFEHVRNVGKKEPGEGLISSEAIEKMNPVLRVLLGLGALAASGPLEEQKAEPFVHPASDTLQ